MPVYSIDLVMPFLAANAVIWAEAYWVPLSELSRIRLNSDAGSQYTSIKFTEAVALEGLVASIGTVGGAYDIAAAETVMGMYKNEAIAKNSPFTAGPLKTLADVERLTFDWRNWYNNSRLHSELGYLSPSEYESNLCAVTNGPLTDDAANITAA